MLAPLGERVTDVHNFFSTSPPPLFPPLFPLPPSPPVFLSFNGLTATTGFEWGASQLFIGIRVFPFSGSTRYDPLTGFVRRADIYEKSWRNKDITSGCASVAVKCRDNVIYPLLYCVNCAHFPDSQLTKHKECKLKLLTISKIVQKYA